MINIIRPYKNNKTFQNRFILLTKHDENSGLTKKFKTPAKIKNGPLKYCYTKYNSINKRLKLPLAPSQRRVCGPSVRPLDEAYHKQGY